MIFLDFVVGLAFGFGLTALFRFRLPFFVVRFLLFFGAQFSSSESSGRFFFLTLGCLVLRSVCEVGAVLEEHHHQRGFTEATST